MIRPALIAMATVCALAGAACDRSDIGTSPETRPNAENLGGGAAGDQHTNDGPSILGGDRGSVAGDAQVPSSQQGVTAQTSFDIVDQNDDGLLSREEASTVEGLDFASADSDESASLSRQEYAVAMEQARPRG